MSDQKLPATSEVVPPRPDYGPELEAKLAGLHEAFRASIRQLREQFGLTVDDAANLARLTPATRERLLLDGKSLP